VLLCLTASDGDDSRSCNEPALRYSPQAYSSNNLLKLESDLLSMSAALRSSALSFSSKRTVMKSFGRFTSPFPSRKTVEQLNCRYILDACQVFFIAPIQVLRIGLNSPSDLIYAHYALNSEERKSEMHHFVCVSCGEHIFAAEGRGRVAALKPGVGLSGAVVPLEKGFPQLVRVFAPSILIRSQPGPRGQLTSQHPVPPLHRSALCDGLFQLG